MTALSKYQRLESAGLWRQDADAQRRDVVVNLGDASLVLSDPRSEMPLPPAPKAPGVDCPSEPMLLAVMLCSTSARLV